MFKIKDKTIYVTRGDRVGFGFKMDNHTFSVGDIVAFRVYGKKQLNKEPLIEKIITVMEECEEVNITLSGKETEIGEMVNKATTYWYEIEYNDDNTVIGFDEDGAKEFILYPEGVE